MSFGMVWFYLHRHKLYSPTQTADIIEHNRDPTPWLVHDLGNGWATWRTGQYCIIDHDKWVSILPTCSFKIVGGIRRPAFSNSVASFL